MNLPKFYDPNDVGRMRRANVRPVIEAARAADSPLSDEDDYRVLLMLIDPQVDFVHKDGALAVPGAVDDTRRTIEWIYRNLDHITDIAVSLDTHSPMQIFYPGWWQDEDGHHPEPMTPITAEEAIDGKWLPVVEKDWSRYYLHELELRAKKTLMIWPYHTMLGTIGHSITPALYEAITFHSEARRSEFKQVIKGRIAKTEYYSFLEPEVKVPEEEGGTLNTGFLKQMAEYDAIYFAGQAKSHCVLESIATIARYDDEDLSLLEKVHLLEDCTSSVTHPDIDFDLLADEELSKYERMGLKRITSETPIQISETV